MTNATGVHRLWPFVAAAVLLWAATLACPLASAQDDDAMSVEEFVQKRDKWQILKGASLKIEGRYRGLAERLSFTNCDLLFEFAEGVKPPPVRGKTIQVTGSIETRQGKLVFVVTRIKALPTDAETLADRRGRLPADDAGPWYTLGDWAAGRGAFYGNDQELLDGAAELRRSAIQIEYRQTGIDDVDTLYALALKAEKLGLPPTIRDEIVHDALQREQRAARKRDTRQREVVLTHILNRLPGAGVSLTLDEATRAQQQEYELQPLEVYQRADADQRRRLHRLFYAAAQLERIELDTAADGSNGFEIARRIDESLPEQGPLAEAHRHREIEYQLAHVPTLPRDDLLRLAERLEARDRASRAAEVKRDWLAAQEPAFRERGSGGLLDLAEEQIALLNDADTAAELYIELFQDPTAQATARTRLVELGYRFDGTTWTKSLAEAPDATADAIRLGVVRRGMTSEQVRAAFGGRPSSVVKFAVRGQVSELWVYRDHGVAIEFSRRGPDADRVAVEISELAAP